MTNRRKPTVEMTYRDPNTGVPQRVLVPEGSSDLSAGIPVSLDISGLYEHMPQEWVRDFTVALHAQGLVKPQDYFQAGASDRYKQALLMIIRHDFLSIQALAKRELDNLK